MNVRRLPGEAIPTWAIAREDLERGVNIVDLFFATGCFASKSEVRRLISGLEARVMELEAELGQRPPDEGREPTTSEPEEALPAGEPADQQNSGDSKS